MNYDYKEYESEYAEQPTQYYSVIIYKTNPNCWVFDTETIAE